MKQKNKKLEGTYKQRISSRGGIFLRVSDSDQWSPPFEGEEGDEIYCEIWPRRIYICDGDDTEFEFIGSTEKIQELIVTLIEDQPLTKDDLKYYGFKSMWDGEEKWSWPIDYDLK